MTFAAGTGSQSWSNSTTCPTGWPKVGPSQPLLFLLSAHLACKVSFTFQHVVLSLQSCDGQNQVNEKDKEEEAKNETESSGPELLLYKIVKTEVLRKPTQTSKMKIDMKKRGKRRRRNFLTLMTTSFPR